MFCWYNVLEDLIHHLRPHLITGWHMDTCGTWGKIQKVIQKKCDFQVSVQPCDLSGNLCELTVGSPTIPDKSKSLEATFSDQYE